MKELTKFEKDILKTILEKEDPEYLLHLETLKVTSREYTGHGQYINFIDLKKNKDKLLTLGKSLYSDINDLDHGSGFMLYIDNGQITCLEMFSHGGEDFPKEIISYKIRV